MSALLELDRIVHYLVDHEQASALAQRIEATIVPARALPRAEQR